MLARILEILEMILPLILQLRGEDDGTADRVKEIQYQCRVIWGIVTDNGTRLDDLESDMALVLSQLQAILDLLPGGGVPAGADVAAEVWGWQPVGRPLDTWNLLHHAGTQAVVKAGMSRTRYAYSPWLAYGNYNMGDDYTDYPSDQPDLNPALMQKGDTLKDWLDRCTDPWCWSVPGGPSNQYYSLTSQENSAIYYICTLTEAAFLEERDRRAGPSDPTETVLAVDVTGDWDDTGGYREYRIDLTTIPSWAGYRVGSPNLYEVNSRAHQLGWCMFGSGTAWEGWQLLVWPTQVVATHLTAPTKFHLELTNGVVADIYGVS